MLDPEVAEAIGGAIGLVFGAGVAWGLNRGKVSRMAKDLNGVAKKLRRTQRAILAAVPAEKRDELIKEFLPD